MDGSALRNVFGSSASLAELSGDYTETTERRSGYSRFGLNEHPPAHQMHTKGRRPSMMAREAARPHLGRRKHWFVALAGLALFGIVQTLVMQLHVPLNVEPDHNQRVVLLAAGALLSIVAGFTIPATDKPYQPNDSSTSGSRNWTTNLVRSYGALLGLVYLTEKLPKDAPLAWVFIAPSLWFIGDGTPNGFVISLLIALVGSAINFSQLPALLNGSHNSLVAFAGTATAYFGSSLVAGNVGRGLRQ